MYYLTVTVFSYFCRDKTAIEKAMMIDDMKVGVLSYTIQADDANGAILEQATEDKPRVMMFGMGRVMKAFSDALRGLTNGDAFAFTIVPDDAFGWPSEENITDVPKTLFMADGKLREELLVVDNVIRMQDKEGRPFEGKILEIADDYFIMDFNHPLAGHSLFVKGKVLDVREPTLEEMNRELEYRKQHAHQCHQHGHSHCGCHDDHCDCGESHDGCCHDA
ncbi:MAG: FKBP-type peptidyl-prolyl cis-trans isomerase [Candidatus Limimorpha sp.]